MRNQILVAVLLSALLIGLAPNKQSPVHLNNSVVRASVPTNAQSATSQADEFNQTTQQPSPQTQNTTVPETQQEQSKPVVQTPVTPREIALSKAVARGWTGAEWNALEKLLGNESNWEIGRLNKTSLACGIGQSLPCSKMYPGLDNDTIRANIVERDGKWYLANPNAEQEIEWTLGYIQERYGSPSKALYFWHNLAPSYNGTHWY